MNYSRQPYGMARVQAWVEQKNGAFVWRMVGYGRLQGQLATQRLAGLYEKARWFINGFQPSFKLISKTREGAKQAKQAERNGIERQPGPSRMAWGFAIILLANN